MQKNKDPNAKMHYLEKTLNNISLRRKTPMTGYFFLLTLYIIATFLLSRLGTVEGGITIGQYTIPYTMFSGAFSSIINLCVIVMVVFYKKLGYVTAMILQIGQLPIIFYHMFVRHSFTTIAGLFTNFFTIIIISLLQANNKRVENYQKRIREHAVTDRLTGLPNSFACTELIRELITKEEPFAMVSVDLNNFKSINDTMGFQIGNEVLQDIAGRWKTVADEGMTDTLDFIIRLSGDEFLMIIRGFESDKQIMDTVRQYEKALERPLTIDGCDLYISASFGYAKYPQDAENMDDLLSFSTAAMTEVKRINSSDRILCFTRDLVKTEQTLEIERKLRTALEKDTIFFNLQPQYDLSHKLRGFEALARITDENGKAVHPSDFIPVAEKTGLVDRVDGAVIRKSCEFFGQLLKKSGADISLSVNTSVRHLMKNNFLDEVKEVLRTSGIPAEKLEIEITESIMIDSAEKALQCIAEIRKLGVKIAIDDFGTGYSSLSYLNNFPANLLKIDKSFIDKMNTSDSSKQYVAAIISIGHIMGFQVISEGVEKSEQLETLHNIDCDFIQGFLWGKPLSAEEAEALVMNSIGA